MDRYSSSRYTPTSSYRSKSPFGRPSSSMSNSSTNLRVETDAFDALNQSLGRHDASFVRDLNTTGSSLNDTIPGRYNPAAKKTGSGKFDSNNNSNYSFGSTGGGANKWKNSDYKNRSFDLNNNTSIGCADSDSDVELSKPRQYTTSYTTTYSSPLYDPLTGSRSNAYTTESKGFQFFATRNAAQPPDGSVDDEHHSLELDDTDGHSTGTDEHHQYCNIIADPIILPAIGDERLCDDNIYDTELDEIPLPPEIVSGSVDGSPDFDNVDDIESARRPAAGNACEARAWLHTSEDDEFDSVSQCTDDSLAKYAGCGTFFVDAESSAPVNAGVAGSAADNIVRPAVLHALGNRTGNSLVRDDELFHGPANHSLPHGGTPTPNPRSRPPTGQSNKPRFLSTSSSSSSGTGKESTKSTEKLTDASQTGLNETTATFDLMSDGSGQGGVKFVSTCRITDTEAVRAVDWHPNGRYFAVGSKSRLLRVFRAANTVKNQDKNNNETSDSLDYSTRPEMIYRRPTYHKGSVFCLSWNKLGTLLATGSNDKTIKLIGFNGSTGEFQDCESTISAHDGTVRDVCFMDDHTNGSSILLSAGAGNCRIYVTDCETSMSFMSLSGHSRPIHALYTWGGAALASGSEDRTIRLWDLRSRDCYNLISCPTISRNRSGGAVTSVAVDPSGRLLVSGHEDSTCMLYDIRAGRVIQTFNPHSAEVRTIRFSNKAYYLLSGGDNRLVLSNLQGDLTQRIPSVEVAQHDDKVISARWHPTDFSFISASADKTAAVWTLQDFDV